MTDHLHSKPSGRNSAKEPTFNRLLDRPKSPKPAKRRAVLRWPVYRGSRWLGDIDAPITAELITFDAITAGGERLGGFGTRLDAALALGARAVQR